MTAVGRKILVTGGAGFLGSHLCARLLLRGESVICVDNLSTGKRANLGDLHTNPRFSFVEADICDAFDLDVDTIYNLASRASPQQYQADPIATMKTNVLGALNCLELAHRRNARVLQASTSEVYGDPEVHPQPESYRGSVNPTGPRACYDEGKRAAETLFSDFRRARGTRIRIARIFNTYGPNMSAGDGRVVPNFIVQALNGGPLTVYGDGKQTRSFCYCDDLVDGLISLMEAGDDVDFPVNLGNPVEYSMLELADQVIEMTGSNSNIVFHPLPVDDPTVRKPDIALARQVLNWRPTIGLRDGLARTIQSFGGDEAYSMVG